MAAVCLCWVKEGAVRAHCIRVSNDVERKWQKDAMGCLSLLPDVVVTVSFRGLFVYVLRPWTVVRTERIAGRASVLPSCAIVSDMNGM